MLIGKLLLITTLFGSVSFRTPAINNCPTDYEIAIGSEGQLDPGKYQPKINYSFQVLHEREVGIYGMGHDIEFHYTKKDRFISKLMKRKIAHYREFSSYYRQVKDMSLQAIDTGYGNNYFMIGYTVAFDSFRDGQIMYYNRIQLDWLTASLRVNPHKTIIECKAEKDFDVGKNLYLTPLIKYINIDSNVDMQAKIILKYKI